MRKYYSHSLNKVSVNISESILKAKNKLENNNLSSISQINYLADQPIANRTQRLDIFNYEDKTNTLFRFNGNYDPIYNEVPLFDIKEDDRYNFNVSLNNFGEIKEIVKSKVNEKNNLLKIKDDSYKSIYPQVDEIGYFIDSHNIFKSTWDTKFYKKTK